MTFYKARHAVRAVLDILFPDRQSEKRPAFDFSRISPKELARLLPKIKKENIKSDITACLSYKNPLVTTLVWHIKTKKDQDAFTCAGYILAEKLTELLRYKNLNGIENVPVIIPVPVNRKRRFERGYNQCELLARELKYSCDKEIEVEIRTNILYRNEHKGTSKKQAFKNRTERADEIRGSFRADAKKLLEIAAIEKRPVIVLDDVLTTGSTIREAMATLRLAGCKIILGLALAH